ncbi:MULTISPECIES: tRNA-dihydrouridine synthase family protein [Butyricimonas]|uniref:tRNA-dihydrouridine synthase family protein n=1 Tax=Butyricimonas TaxID=574697 RepID=UPI001D05FC12|nr:MULTISPECIES: tRNA-dihydrouridine synthase family protein [Butyricimonas]MCB6973767.1 tRNA-dihydrouridine synthase family protein [Butyricimonas synergistica]MCG4520578.1 tRNA-dihydrouridine synthase family protein [Butyricimonas sp. DFI.6.44]
MEKQKKYKIHFAPVQGHTDWTYRNLHEKYFGGVDAYYTPFIRVEKGDSFRSRDMKDCDPELNTVQRLIPQVLGGDPMELDVSLEMLEERGFTGVDINMGCPFPMIARRGKGAGVLSDPKRVRELMEVVKEYPGMQCSVKMRLGWENPEECLSLLPVLNDTPLTAVILHARVGTQEYKGEVNPDAFEAFYNQCKHPLYYNGDVLTLEDIQRVTARFPRLEGVMIGRGLLANPALAMEYLNGKELTSEEKYRKFKLFHAELLAAYAERLQGEHQLVMKMKTFWEYFMPMTDRKILKKIHKSNKLSQYNEALARAFVPGQEEG